MRFETLGHSGHLKVATWQVLKLSNAPKSLKPHKQQAYKNFPGVLVIDSMSNMPLTLIQAFLIFNIDFNKVQV